jgi:steroid delta-isomerase-like uncharacterized protein
MRPVSVTALLLVRHVLLTVCLFILISGLSPEQLIAQGETVKDQNKQLIHIESEEVGNKGDLSKIPELYTTDFVRHFLPNNTQTNGLAGFKSQMANLHDAFPHWSEQIILMAAERDYVAIWFVVSGTNTGSFLGNSPTGRRTVNNVMSFFRIAGGKIAEQWLLPDLFSMNSQLGLIPGKERVEIDGKDAWQALEIDPGIDSVELQRNKDLALLANEQVWTVGNFESLREMFSDDFVQHFLPFGTRTEGLEEFRKRLVEHRQAFPDWTEVVNLVVAEGDYIFLQFTSTGTNTGSFLGKPPTDKKININEVTIFRIADGKIAEQWLLPDILSLNQQLGIIPSGD